MDTDRIDIMTKIFRNVSTNDILNNYEELETVITNYFDNKSLQLTTPSVERMGEYIANMLGSIKDEDMRDIFKCLKLNGFVRVATYGVGDKDGLFIKNGTHLNITRNKYGEIHMIVLDNDTGITHTVLIDDIQRITI